jgi:hypothetical protein
MQGLDEAKEKPRCQEQWQAMEKTMRGAMETIGNPGTYLGPVVHQRSRAMEWLRHSSYCTISSRTLTRRREVAMRVNWSFADRFHIERAPDMVVIRSQWGNLVVSIVIGGAYIAGVISISAANKLLESHDWFPWTVTSGLVLCGLLIMVPRRMTVSFERRNKKAVRVYSAAFGLFTRRREILFHDIASVAVRNFENDGDALSEPIIRRKNDEVISLAMRGGSRDEARTAAQAISSGTGIMLEDA